MAKAKEESEAWRRQAEAFQAQLAAMNSTAGKFSEKMVEAADTLDPLVLKEMFRAKEGLDEKVRKLEDLLANRGAGGVLFLDADQLLLRVKSFRGDMALRVWIDDESDKNYVFKSHLKSTSPPVLVAFNVAQALWDHEVSKARSIGIGNVFGNMNMGPLAEPGFAARRAEIDERYEARVTKAFAKFIRDNAYEKPSTPVEAFLRDQLRRGGYHTIGIHVEPLDREPWGIEIQLLRKGEESEHLLKTYEFNSRLFPSPPVMDVFAVWVKYADETGATAAPLQ